MILKPRMILQPKPDDSETKTGWFRNRTLFYLQWMAIIMSFVVTHPLAIELTVSISETGARPEEAQHTSVTTVLAAPWCP